MAVTLLAALACAGWLVGRRPGEPAVLLALAALGVLALGYTAPLLRLSWRGWGELDVALTHGIGVLVVGYLLQGGGRGDALPWLSGLPIALAVLPSILLSGLPDADADRAAGKRTLAVRLGVQCAGWLAWALVPSAPLAVIALGAAGSPAHEPYAGVLGFALPHAGLLLLLLWRRLRGGLRCERIDGAMVVALSYILWFAGWPLARLWTG